MSSYEAMLILRPSLKGEEQKALVGEAESILKEQQANVENVRLFGRRNLAYEIGKEKEGFYYLINFSTEHSAVITALKNACKINENILRILIVKRHTI